MLRKLSWKASSRKDEIVVVTEQCWYDWPKNIVNRHYSISFMARRTREFRAALPKVVKLYSWRPGHQSSFPHVQTIVEDTTVVEWESPSCSSVLYSLQTVLWTLLTFLLVYKVQSEQKNPIQFLSMLISDWMDSLLQQQPPLSSGLSRSLPAMGQRILCMCNEIALPVVLQPDVCAVCSPFNFNCLYFSVVVMGDKC